MRQSLLKPALAALALVMLSSSEVWVSRLEAG